MLRLQSERKKRSSPAPRYGSPPQQTRSRKKRSSKELYDDGHSWSQYDYIHRFGDETQKRFTVQDLNRSTPSKYSSDALQMSSCMGNIAEELKMLETNYDTMAAIQEKHQIRRRPVGGNRAGFVPEELRRTRDEENLSQVDYGFAQGAENPYSQTIRRSPRNGRSPIIMASPPVSSVSGVNRFPTHRIKSRSPQFSHITGLRRRSQFNEEMDLDGPAVFYAAEHRYEQPYAIHQGQQIVDADISPTFGDKPTYDNAYKQAECMCQCGNFSARQIQESEAFRVLKPVHQESLLKNYRLIMADSAGRQSDSYSHQSRPEVIRRRAKLTPVAPKRRSLGETVRNFFFRERQ